jgi:hypothetical protein
MIALLTHGADCNAAGIDGVTPFYNMANFLLTSNDITENFKEKVESTTMWTPAMVRWANRIPTRDHDGDRQSDFIGASSDDSDEEPGGRGGGLGPGPATALRSRTAMYNSTPQKALGKVPFEGWTWVSQEALERALWRVFERTLEPYQTAEDIPDSHLRNLMLPDCLTLASAIILNFSTPDDINSLLSHTPATAVPPEGPYRHLCIISVLLGRIMMFTRGGDRFQPSKIQLIGARLGAPDRSAKAKQGKEFAVHMQALLLATRDNLEAAQDTQRADANRHRRDHDFKVGDMILLVAPKDHIPYSNLVPGSIKLQHEKGKFIAAVVRSRSYVGYPQKAHVRNCPVFTTLYGLSTT